MVLLAQAAPTVEPEEIQLSGVVFLGLLLLTVRLLHTPSAHAIRRHRTAQPSTTRMQRPPLERELRQHVDNVYWISHMPYRPHAG